MKKYAFMLFGLLLTTAIIVSCAKEDLDEQIPTTEIQEIPEEDAPELRIGPARPDLIISDYFTNIGVQSRLCTDTLLETTHCAIGPRTFIASVIIDNIGVAPLPAGTVDVLWFDLTWGQSAIQTVPHGGIPVGGSITVSRSYYVGPCDCVDNPQDSNCFVHRYLAFVDPNFIITELNETNNISEIHDTCDGCGPCAMPVEPVGPR